LAFFIAGALPPAARSLACRPMPQHPDAKHTACQPDGGESLGLDASR
jgi:hypothetical protein